LLLALYLGVWGQPERWEYDVIALNIHAGRGHLYERDAFPYLAYAPPLWSYLLAGLLELPGASRASIQVVQGFFCLGTAFACAELARRLTGRGLAAGVCAGLVALQPSLLYYSVVKSDPLPLNALLLSLIVLGSAIVVEKPLPARSLGLGLLIALATLSRGTPVIVAPIAATLLIRRFGAAGLGPALAMIGGLAIGLAPWLVRNALYLGEPLITTTSGENLWRGNNDLATGGVRDPRGRSLTRLNPDADVFPPAIARVLASGTELDREHIFRVEALRFIRERPADAFRLFIAKLRSFWWKIESRPEDYSPVAAAAYEWIYRSELVLGLGGLFWGLRRSRSRGSAAAGTTFALLVGTMAGVSALQAAFYVEGRHRFLIEPLLLVFTASALAAMVERRSGESFPRTA
jgi:hypothetical protein